MLNNNEIYNIIARIQCNCRPCPVSGMCCVCSMYIKCLSPLCANARTHTYEYNYRERDIAFCLRVNEREMYKTTVRVCWCAAYNNDNGYAHPYALNAWKLFYSLLSLPLWIKGQEYQRPNKMYCSVCMLLCFRSHYVCVCIVYFCAMDACILSARICYVYMDVYMVTYNIRHVCWSVAALHY